RALAAGADSPHCCCAVGAGSGRAKPVTAGRRGRVPRGLLTALLPLLWAAGCGSPEPPRRLVSVWAMGREGAVIAQLLPEFTKLHPDIEVRIQQLPWTAAHQKLLTAFAGEATPDLCQLGNTWIPEFVALKALEPLDRSLA